MKNFITVVEKTNEKFRSNVIIHNNFYHFAEMNTVKQLESFSKLFGFTYKLEEVSESEQNGKYERYSMSHAIDDRCGGGFWKLSDIPENVKPFKGLSNGSIVDCYFLNDGKTIHIYRPNPNAKEVYKPLSIKEHISFIKNNYMC